MAKIYRYEIELPDNTVVGAYGGMFNTKSKQLKYLRIQRSMCDKHGGCNEHPPIWKDLVGFDSGTHYCACPSLEKLKTWFDGYNERLIEIGYKLVEIEVKKTFKCISGLQIAYQLKDVIEKKVIESLVVSK